MEETLITNDLILEGRRTRAAIFAVEHAANGKRLIVATKRLSKRLHDQRKYLDGGQHHNAALQADLELDGPDAFRFVLLELVDDPRDLRPLKRMHVEETRRLGLSYHAPEPQCRKRLTVAISTTEPTPTALLARIERWGRTWGRES